MESKSTYLMLPVTDAFITPGLKELYPKKLTSLELQILTMYCMENINSEEAFIDVVLDHVGYISLLTGDDLCNALDAKSMLLSMALSIFHSNLNNHMLDIMGTYACQLSYADDRHGIIMVRVHDDMD